MGPRADPGLSGAPLQSFKTTAELPYNDYFEYYTPDFRLHFPITNMENLNTREYLEKYTYVTCRIRRNARAAAVP